MKDVLLPSVGTHSSPSPEPSSHLHTRWNVLYAEGWGVSSLCNPVFYSDLILL